MELMEDWARLRCQCSEVLQVEAYCVVIAGAWCERGLPKSSMCAFHCIVHCPLQVCAAARAGQTCLCQLEQVSDWSSFVSVSAPMLACMRDLCLLHNSFSCCRVGPGARRRRAH